MEHYAKLCLQLIFSAEQEAISRDGWTVLDMSMVALRNSFEGLLNSVDNCILDAEKLQLVETVALLKMVRLDIVTRANGISGEELDVFLFAVESELRLDLETHLRGPSHLVVGHALGGKGKM
jgi:hypothetical protein